MLSLLQLRRTQGFAIAPRLRAHSARAPGGSLLFRCAEVGGLLLLVIFLGTVLIPSHWTSLWMDREFTGWVAPIANRLGEGLILYGEHGHLPMPPLPFVLLHLLTQGEATWLSESLCNFVFLALTLGMLYAGFSLFMRPPLPFLTTVATAALFFSLPKTILYDAMAQCGATLSALLALWFLRMPAPTRWGRTVQITLLGLSTALTLLCKQSTGMGVVVGVTLALLFTAETRLKGGVSLLAYATATLAFMALLLALLTPWLDWQGFIRDVLLTGAEPKGGARQLAQNLVLYGIDFSQHLFLVGTILLLGAWIFRVQLNDVEEVENPAPSQDEASWRDLVMAGLTVAVVLLGIRWFPGFAKHIPALLKTGHELLWLGLLAGLLLALRACFPRTLSVVRRFSQGDTLGLLVLITFCTAVFHSLSVSTFRWSYDSNPLIAGVFATLYFLLFEARSPNRRAGRLVQFAGCIVLQLLAWSHFAEQWVACHRCTEAWEEVAYLHGARLPASAQGMRDLVHQLRALAPNPQVDRVLLLPSDPNVESWFARQRPALSSPILFADQYWDQRVEVDLEALRRQPPRVIVIGPRQYWRSFQRHWNKNYGTERLIDAVQRELLPRQYEHRLGQPILHRGGTDFMDVYVRKETLPP